MIPLLTVASMLLMFFYSSTETKVQTACLFLSVGLIFINILVIELMQGILIFILDMIYITFFVKHMPSPIKSALLAIGLRIFRPDIYFQTRYAACPLHAPAFSDAWQRTVLFPYSYFNKFICFSICCIHLIVWVFAVRRDDCKRAG